MFVLVLSFVLQLMCRKCPQYQTGKETKQANDSSFYIPVTNDQSGRKLPTFMRHRLKTILLPRKTKSTDIFLVVRIRARDMWRVLGTHAAFIAEVIQVGRFRIDTKLWSVLPTEIPHLLLWFFLSHQP